MATPAVPNSSYEVARSNLETLDGYINNTSGVVVNRDGQSLTPIPVLNTQIAQAASDATNAIVSIAADVAAVDAAATSALAVEIPAQINRLGLQYPPIAYIAGLTLDSYVKTYSYDDALYIWSGTLGTVTTGDFDETGWQPIQGDIQLRNDVTKGTSLIRDVKHLSGIFGLGVVVPQYDGQQFSVAGFYVDSVIGGGVFVWDASRSKADHNGGTVIAPEAIVAWDGTQADLATLLNWTGSGSGCYAMLSGMLINNCTVKIPQHFADIGAAIDGMAFIACAPSVKIILLIQAGHRPTKGAVVKNGDFSRFWIESEYSPVLVADSWEVGYSVVDAEYAQAPVLNSLWNCNGLGGWGYRLRWASAGMVRPRGGVMNIPRKSGVADATHGSGLQVWDSSRCYAPESVFTGSFRNVNLSTSSSLEARNSNFSGAVSVNALTGEEAANVFSGRSCSLHIVNSNLSGSQGWGLVASRTLCGANACNISGNNNGVRVDHGGTISLQDSNVSNNTQQGVVIEGPAIVTLRRAYLDDNGTNGISFQNGATIDLTDASVTGNANHGVTGNSSVITARGANIQNNGNCGVFGVALTLKAQDAVISGNTVKDISGDIDISGQDFTVTAGDYYSNVSLTTGKIVISAGTQFDGYEIYSNGRINLWKSINIDRSITTVQQYAIDKEIIHFSSISFNLRESLSTTDAKVIASLAATITADNENVQVLVTDPQADGLVNAVMRIEGFIAGDENWWS